MMINTKDYIQKKVRGPINDHYVSARWIAQFEEGKNLAVEFLKLLNAFESAQNKTNKDILGEAKKMRTAMLSELENKEKEKKLNKFSLFQSYHIVYLLQVLILGHMDYSDETKSVAAVKECIRSLKAQIDEDLTLGVDPFTDMKDCNTHIDNIVRDTFTTLGKLKGNNNEKVKTLLTNIMGDYRSGTLLSQYELKIRSINDNIRELTYMLENDNTSQRSIESFFDDRSMQIKSKDAIKMALLSQYSLILLIANLGQISAFLAGSQSTPSQEVEMIDIIINKITDDNLPKAAEVKKGLLMGQQVELILTPTAFASRRFPNNPSYDSYSRGETKIDLGPFISGLRPEDFRPKSLPVVPSSPKRS